MRVLKGGRRERPGRLLLRRSAGPQTMPVFGLTRFSIVLEDGRFFNRGRELPLKERRALVLSDDRLAQRFQLFESLTLPSLAAQGD
ncbi:MAG: glycosyltransferase, partial [Pseudomonadota bacterium]